MRGRGDPSAPRGGPPAAPATWGPASEEHVREGIHSFPCLFIHWFNSSLCPTVHLRPGDTGDTVCGLEVSQAKWPPCAQGKAQGGSGGPWKTPARPPSVCGMNEQMSSTREAAGSTGACDIREGTCPVTCPLKFAPYMTSLVDPPFLKLDLGFQGFVFLTTWGLGAFPTTNPQWGQGTYVICHPPRLAPLQCNSRLPEEVIYFLAGSVWVVGVSSEL